MTSGDVRDAVHRQLSIESSATGRGARRDRLSTMRDALDAAAGAACHAGRVGYPMYPMVGLPLNHAARRSPTFGQTAEMHQADAFGRCRNEREHDDH